MASFEQQLKQRLANASKPAPAADGDWERLQAALAANAPKKKRAAWWLWGTAAVGVIGLGVLIGSWEMGDGSGKMEAGKQLPSALADGMKKGSGKREVGSGDMKVGNELPNVAAGFTPAHKKERKELGNVKANQLPTAVADELKEQIVGKSALSLNVDGGFESSQLPAEPLAKADDNKSEANTTSEIPKPETPSKTNTPPTPPKIQLPKKPSLPIRAGIETTVLGSKQNAKGGNAAFAQLRKDGDKRTLGYSSQLTLELKTKNYELATGLGFQQQNFGGNYIYPYKWVDSFPVYVGGVIVGWGKNPPRDTTLNYNLSSTVKTVFVPVKIRFNQKLGSKWGAIVETGMQYGIVVVASGQFISPDKNLPNILDLQMLRKHTLSLSLGLGGYYDANRWLRLYLRTGYGRQMTSIFKQYNTTSNSLSLTFGCQFKL